MLVFQLHIIDDSLFAVQDQLQVQVQVQLQLEFPRDFGCLNKTCGPVLQ